MKAGGAKAGREVEMGRAIVNGRSGLPVVEGKGIGGSRGRCKSKQRRLPRRIGFYQCEGRKCKAKV